MFCIFKKKKLYPPYLSKHNSNLEKQIIFLMVKGEGREAMFE